MPFNAAIASPLQDRATGELCAVIADNTSRLSVDAHKCIQLPCDPSARDAGVSYQAQVLTAAVVIHDQYAEPAPVSWFANKPLPGSGCAERIRHKIKGPTLARPQYHGHRCPRSTCSLATSSPSDAQLFLGVDAIQLLVIHGHALAFQQHTDPAVAEPTPFAGYRIHLFANFRIVWRMIPPNSLRIDTRCPATHARICERDQPARTTL